MKLHILVIHGPNLNLLGVRERELYGPSTLAEINQRLQELGAELGVEVECVQSNSEGQIIDLIHEARLKADAVVINPGAYTHYSFAIRDAVAAASVTAVEVHMTNIAGREEWRRHSVIAPVCAGQIAGFGPLSYELGLRAAVELVRSQREPRGKVK